MNLYGDMDRTRDGKIASEYPAWTQITQCDALRQHIGEVDSSIKHGSLSGEGTHEARQNKADLEKRLDDIMRSKPNPSDAEKNLLYKHYKSIGAKIQESMFTRSDMNFGLASAREEARRMKGSCIKLAPDECGIAESCNVTVDSSKKVSRDQASKVFKLLGKILGEPANIEVLRLDSKKEAYMPVETQVTPLAPHHVEAIKAETQTAPAKEIPTTKSGKPDKRYTKE